mmetsp:Transcript_77337/g.107487  ORF Transcript_77337/g.107487 Transcript_77337/m.107487 type:complete len:255 (+) Transcript_77337:106-870(+)
MQQADAAAIHEIKANPENYEPNWEQLVKDLKADPATTGWKLEKDEQIGKNVGTHQRIYTKKLEGDSVNYVRFDAVFTDIDITKYMVMMNDIEVRKTWDERAKGMKCLGKINENSELVYNIVELPFPLTNRDGTNRKFIFHNKTHADFFKKAGLPEVEHNMYLVVIYPMALKDYPETSKYVRSKFFLAIICEENPELKGSIKINATLKSDMGGNIPDFVVNLISVKMPSKMNENIMIKYQELDKAGVLDKKFVIA